MFQTGFSNREKRIRIDLLVIISFMRPCGASVAMFHSSRLWRCLPSWHAATFVPTHRTPRKTFAVRFGAEGLEMTSPLSSRCSRASGMLNSVLAHTLSSMNTTQRWLVVGQAERPVFFQAQASKAASKYLVSLITDQLNVAG